MDYVSRLICVTFALLVVVMWSPCVESQGLYETHCSVAGYPTQSHQASEAACCEALRTLPNVDWDTVTVVPGSGPPSGTFQCDLVWNGAHDTGYGQWSPCVEGQECGAPEPECDERAGDKFTVRGPLTAGQTACNAGCSAAKLGESCLNGGPQCITWYRVSAFECTTEPDSGASDDPGENCLISGGVELCATPQKENCGYVNDNFVCLGSVEPDGCAVFPDGGRLCGSVAPTPPVPDNGSDGQPASPDGNIQAGAGGDTFLFNFFNSTTVNNSSRPPGNSGDNPYDGEDDGNGAGGDGTEDEGEGSASGGETCAAAPACDGDAIACAILAQEWKARCPDAVTEAQAKAVTGDHETIPSEEFDLSTSLSESLVSSGGGECPSPPVINVPVFGSVTITVITWFCALAAKIAVLVMMSAYVAAALIVAGRM